MIQIERRNGEVHVWWDGDNRYYLDDDEESTNERPPDLVITQDQANELVMELLRGPMGPQGPMGPKGD